MKHPNYLTILLILLFIISQLIGLNIISNYVNIDESFNSGNTVLYDDNYIVQPPEVENESLSWILIFISVLIGTMLFLLIIKFNLTKIWKSWFGISIFLSLFIAFFPYIKFILKFPENYSILVTLIFVLVLTYFKLFKKNYFIHNLTEIFMYGGICALFVPILNIFSASVLLILISFYDMYAVWKSKHMVKMANFQIKDGLFAGISLPYTLNNNNNNNNTKTKQNLKLNNTSINLNKNKINTKDAHYSINNKSNINISSKIDKKSYNNVTNAILGGGDITFPLLFAGALLKVTGNYMFSIMIIFGATAGLTLLLFISKRDRFYPAMPFISAGVFIMYLVGFFIF